jgi:hypothetical protein
VSIHSKARLGLVAAVVGACLLVAVPALGVNRDGVWRGSTSQDRTVRFEVRGDTITAVKISVLHKECNLTVSANARRTNFPISDDGTFTMRFFGGEGRDRLVVRGEFTSRRRAKGIVRSFQESPDCRERLTRTWRVHSSDRLGASIEREDA